MATNRNNTERAVGKADVNGLGWWKWFFIFILDEWISFSIYGFILG